MALGGLLGQLWVDLSVNTAGLNVANNALLNFQNQTNNVLSRINNDLDRTANQFQRFGTAATMYVTLPMTLIGGKSLKMANDLEFASQKIVALAGISQEQMNSWAGDIQRIGNLTNIASKDLAEALYYTASAGLKSAEAIEVLEYAAKASATGLGETQEVARLLTYAINAYGKANITAAYATDVLVAAVREGTAEASTLANVMGSILPVASAMGVSFDQVGGALAAMTRTGFNAFMASTSLRQILVSLLHPTHEAEEALSTMTDATTGAALSAAKLRKTLREDGLMSVLSQINDLTKRYGEDTVGMLIPNVRALSGALSLMGENMAENEKVMLATKNAAGAMNEAFDIMTQTTSFRMGQMKRATENAFLALGKSMQEPLIPILKEISEQINNLANWFSNLDSTIQKVILSTGLLAAALGPAAMLMSGLLKIVAGLRIAYAFVAAEISLVGMAVSRLSILLAANPYAAAIGALLLLGAAMYDVNNKSVKVTQTQITFNRIAEQTARTIATEKGALDGLYKTILNENVGKEAKVVAIKKIAQLYPDYLGFIDEESVKTGKAKEAIDAYLKMLEALANKRGAEKEIVDLDTQRYSDVSKGKDEELGLWQKVGSYAQAAISKQTQAEVAADMANRNREASANRYLIARSNLEDSRDQEIDNNKMIEFSYLSLGKQMESVKNLSKPKLEELQLKIVSQRTQLEAETALMEKEYAKREAIWQKAYDAYSAAESGSKEETELKKTATREARKLDIITDANAKKKAEYDSYLSMYEKYISDLDALIAKKNEEDAAVELNKNQKQEVQDILRNYAEGIKSIQSLEKIWGDNIDNTGKKYDGLSERASLYNTTVAGLGKLLGETNPLVEKFAKLLLSSGGETGFSIVVMRDLSLQLEQVDARYKQTGDSVEHLTSLIGVYAEANKKLAGAGVSGTVEVKGNTSKIAELTKELSDKTLQKSLADAAMQASLMGNSFDFLGAKMGAHKTKLSDLNQQLEVAKNKQDDTSRALAIAGILEEKEIINLTRLDIAYKTLTDGLNIADISYKNLGGTYDTLSAKIQVYDAQINTLIALLNTFEEGTAEAALAQSDLDNAINIRKFTQLEQITKDYNATLAENAIYEEVLGSKFNIKLANIEAEITAKKALIATLREDNAERREQIRQLAILEKTKIKIESQADLVSTFTQAGQAASNFIGTYSTLVNVQQEKALALIDKTAKEQRKSEQWVTDEKLKINKAFGEKMKKMAIAQAIINGAIAITNIWANSKDPTGISQMILSALSAANTIAQVAVISAQTMAQGGIVPSGYPNDSYPARLTSGEMVIPPSRLPDFQNIQSNKKLVIEFKPVTMRQQGRELVGVLEEMSILQKSY